MDFFRISFYKKVLWNRSKMDLEWIWCDIILFTFYWKTSDNKKNKKKIKQFEGPQKNLNYVGYKHLKASWWCIFAKSNCFLGGGSLPYQVLYLEQECRKFSHSVKLKIFSHSLLQTWWKVKSNFCDDHLIVLKKKRKCIKNSIFNIC